MKSETLRRSTDLLEAVTGSFVLLKNEQISRLEQRVCISQIYKIKHQK